MVGLSFSPDLVVVHCVNNDMEPMRAMQPKVDYSHYRRAMNVVQTEAGAARFRQDAGDIVDAVIAKWSKLYVYAKLFQSGQVPPRASLHALTTWNNDTQPEPGARGVAIFERNLRSIAALASAPASGRHVPFRDSKLTRLLMSSLGGNTKTALCVTVGPALHNYDETFCTLLLATRAMAVKNYARVNERLFGKPFVPSAPCPGC